MYLMGHWIKLTKELAHCDRLWVDCVVLNLHFFIISSLIHQGQGVGQDM